MVSEITLASLQRAPTGGWLSVVRWRGCACVGGHVQGPSVGCVCVTGSRMGPKVVGILLEGEKYEPASGALPTACVRDRIERKRAKDRKAESQRVREGRNGGCFACSHPLLAVLFKKLASSRRER